ncbi:MAG: LptF/LptG family permease [Deltaproteobacteria bacterium]
MNESIILWKKQLIPVSIMLAGIITIGLLHHNRELLGLQSAGISLTRIVRPAVLAATVFTLFVLASSQWLMPATQTKVDRIWYEEVNQTKPTGILRNGLIFYKGREGIYTVGKPQGKEHNLYAPFLYVNWDKSFGFKQLITAKQGRWTAGKWLLTDGVQESGNTPEDLHVQMFAKQFASLPEGPDKLLVPPYKTKELSLSALYRMAWSQPDEQSYKARLQFFEKLSYITLGLPLLLIGLPILLLICRSHKRDLSIAVPASCLLAFVVWAIWGVLQSLAKTSHIHIFVAAWLLHVVIIASGILFMRRLSQA